MKQKKRYEVGLDKLRSAASQDKSWKPECVLSCNMDWQILVNFTPHFWLGIKY
jgi:hypothetical protein